MFEAFCASYAFCFFLGRFRQFYLRIPICLLITLSVMESVKFFMQQLGSVENSESMSCIVMTSEIFQFDCIFCIGYTKFSVFCVTVVEVE